MEYSRVDLGVERKTNIGKVDKAGSGKHVRRLQSDYQSFPFPTDPVLVFPRILERLGEGFLDTLSGELLHTSHHLILIDVFLRRNHGIAQGRRQSGTTEVFTDARESGMGRISSEYRDATPSPWPIVSLTAAEYNHAIKYCKTCYSLYDPAVGRTRTKRGIACRRRRCGRYRRTKRKNSSRRKLPPKLQAALAESSSDRGHPDFSRLSSFGKKAPCSRHQIPSAQRLRYRCLRSLSLTPISLTARLYASNLILFAWLSLGLFPSYSWIFCLFARPCWANLSRSNERPQKRTTSDPGRPWARRNPTSSSYGTMPSG